MQSKTPSSTAVWMILASTWPLANRARSENSILLEPLDDPIASAFGLERRNDAVFHHTANFAIGGIPVDLGDLLVFCGRKDFAMAVVGQQKSSLTTAHLRGAKLIQPAEIIVVYRSAAQGYDKEKSFG